MEQERILIERNSRNIANMTAFLEMRCRIANTSLQKIKNEVLPGLNVTDAIAKGIAEGKADPILAAMRGSLEEEATSKIAIVRESQINSNLRLIEERINSIFSKSEESPKGLRYLFSVYDIPPEWGRYIIFDGDKITYDEKAVEEDNSTFIIPESAQCEYLKMAEQLCKQISEFIILTQKLGYGNAVSSNEDSVIYIAERNRVQLDSKKITWLNFSGYGAALEAAQQSAGFERENVNH